MISARARRLVSACGLVAVAACTDGGGTTEPVDPACAELADEMLEFTQDQFDAIDGGEAPDREGATELSERIVEAGCAPTVADASLLACDGIDELEAAGDLATLALEQLEAMCDFSAPPAVLEHQALAPCRAADGEAVESPIPESDGFTSTALADRLGGGFEFASERYASRDGERTHDLTHNRASSTVAQGLTRERLDDAVTWNEFRWDDPMWSSRTESEPWSTREEPNAFEPQYQFAFFGHAQSTTAAVGYPGSVPTFERAIEDDGVRLLQFCFDSAAGLSLAAPTEPSATRFLAHPDGYVVEYVEAGVDARGQFCLESTLDLGAVSNLGELEDTEPPEHVVELRHLAGCADLVEG